MYVCCTFRFILLVWKESLRVPMLPLVQLNLISLGTAFQCTWQLYVLSSTGFRNVKYWLNIGTQHYFRCNKYFKGSVVLSKEILNLRKDCHLIWVLYFDMSLIRVKSTIFYTYLKNWWHLFSKHPIDCSVIWVSLVKGLFCLHFLIIFPFFKLQHFSLHMWLWTAKDNWPLFGVRVTPSSVK